jgi:site-specific DNA recombinase
MDSSSQRVALYTRISTDETNQPYSLGAQRDRMLAHISSQAGWQVVAEYEDHASGKSLGRPALADARRAAAAGTYDLLLVFRVDRLSRNLGQLAVLIEELEAAGVAFRSLTEPFDTTNPAGRMMVQMLGVFAEFERASIIERISAGMERKASRGEWTVGSYPYGYRRGASGPGLEPDPAAAQVVGDMFHRYLTQRLGSGPIATWLNERGLRTTRGQPWTRASVLRVLGNRVYRGEVPFRGVWHPGRHEAIVEADVFEAAQRLRASRAHAPSQRRANPSPFLLSGLHLVCDRCGSPLVGTAAHNRSRRYDYYTCVTRLRHGRAACDQDRLRRDHLEAAVLGQLTEIYANTDLLRASLAAADQQWRQEHVARQERIAALALERVDLEHRLQRYLLAFEEGRLRPETCQSRIDQIELRLGEVASEETALTLESDPGDVGSVDLDFASVLLGVSLDAIMAERLPPARSKALLAQLIDEVRVVSRQDVRVTYRVPPEVRIPDGMVEMRGLEPLTPAMRTRCSPN